MDGGRRRLLVMFGNTLRRHDTAETLVARWVPRIAVRAPHWDVFTDEACYDLARAVANGDEDVVRAALARFGRQLGQHGWLLREITGWVDELAQLVGSRNRTLSHFLAGVAVAQGWSDGAMNGTQTDQCIDPLTGLATLPVLHLRLSQAYDQSAALGSSAGDLYCLVVVDTVMTELHPFERDAVRAVVAELVTETFNGGETIAHLDGRIMVLASSHEQIRERLLDLIVAFDRSPLLDTCSPVCWIEQLPDSQSKLDRYLFELSPTGL